jgi:hypothetical protein
MLGMMKPHQTRVWRLVVVGATNTVAGEQRACADAIIHLFFGGISCRVLAHPPQTTWLTSLTVCMWTMMTQ